MHARSFSVMSMLIVLLGGSSCVDRAYDERDYRACSRDEDCNDGATCSRNYVSGVCRPSCEVDADCPETDGPSPRCDLGDDARGQCVLPCEGCPDGMICTGATPSPESGLICTWKS
jgi:hypothetical protein